QDGSRHGDQPTGPAPSRRRGCILATAVTIPLRKAAYTRKPLTAESPYPQTVAGPSVIWVSAHRCTVSRDRRPGTVLTTRHYASPRAHETPRWSTVSPATGAPEGVRRVRPTEEGRPLPELVIKVLEGRHGGHQVAQGHLSAAG